MKRNSEAMRSHKVYLRAKIALRDQHQDAYSLMLERHSQELDSLWGSYNLAVKKLAEEHNVTTKTRIVAIRKETKKTAAQKSEEKLRSQKPAAPSFKVLPMKKRVKRELDTEVEERSHQNDELIDDVTPITASAWGRNVILPKFLGFMRL